MRTSLALAILAAMPFNHDLNNRFYPERKSSVKDPKWNLTDEELNELESLSGKAKKKFLKHIKEKYEH